MSVSKCHGSKTLILHMSQKYKHWLVSLVKWLQKYLIDPILWISFNWTSLNGPKTKSGMMHPSKKFPSENL